MIDDITFGGEQKMKRFVIAAAVLTATAAQALAADGYVEGQLGYAMLQDVDSKTYSGTSNGITATNLKLTLDYDNALAFGAEAGILDFGLKNVRLGLGIKYFEAELNAATLSGTLTSGGTTWTGPTTVSGSSLNGTFDNTVMLYSLNGYYDFKSKYRLTPFVGAGIGLANIENSDDIEFGGNLSAGVNFDLTEKAYMGIKGDYHYIAGPKDKYGIEYEAIQAMTAMVTLGYRF
ncbi:outer membrane protein [Magnetospira thiophila]